MWGIQQGDPAVKPRTHLASTELFQDGEWAPYVFPVYRLLLPVGFLDLYIFFT
jgi:hypothetical protein